MHDKFVAWLKSGGIRGNCFHDSVAEVCAWGAHDVSGGHVTRNSQRLSGALQGVVLQTDLSAHPRMWNEAGLIERGAMLSVPFSRW